MFVEPVLDSMIGSQRRWTRQAGTMAWLLAFRKRSTLYDRTAATITALTPLAIAITGMRKLAKNDY